MIHVQGSLHADAAVTHLPKGSLAHQVYDMIVFQVLIMAVRQQARHLGVNLLHIMLYTCAGCEIKSLRLASQRSVAKSLALSMLSPMSA
jgi:hypothetical protein